MWKVSLDTFHNFKNIGFILKVSVQKTLSTISIQIVKNFEFMLKVSLQEIPSIITKKMELYLNAFHNFKNLGLYWKCLLKRHFPQIFNGKFQILKGDILQFPKNRIILKVSLQETPSIIWKKKNGFIRKVSLERHFPQNKNKNIGFK